MRLDNPSISGSISYLGGGTNIISGIDAKITGSFTGSFTGEVLGTSSISTTASYIKLSNVDGSASLASRITINSASIASLETVSGSYANSASFASDISANSASISSLEKVSGSYANSASFASNISANSASIGSLNSVSGSYANSASFASDISTNSSSIGSLNAVSSSYLLNTTDTLTGDLTVTGNIIATTLNVQDVTASVVYSSGSNIFGSSSIDTQQFTGSILTSGSIEVNGDKFTVSGATGDTIVAGKVMLGSGTPVRKLELKTITGARNLGIGLNDKDGVEQATIAVDQNTNDLITATKSNMRFFTNSTIGSIATLPTNQALLLDTSLNATFSGDVNVNTAAANGPSIRLIHPDSSENPEIRIQSGESGTTAFSIYNTATDPDAEQFFINTTTSSSHLGNKRGALKLEDSTGVNLTLNLGNSTFAGTLQSGNFAIGVAPSSFGTGVPTITLQGTAANGRGGAIVFKEQDGTVTSNIYSTDGSDGYGTVINAAQGSFRVSVGALAANKLEINSSGNASFAGSIILSDSSYQAAYSIRRNASALIFSGGTSGFYFNRHNNSLTDVYINGDGNVGIGVTNMGSTGLSIRNNYNFNVSEGVNSSFLNIFRQASSAATVIANGYKYSGNANAFASSYASNWAKSAIALNYGTIRFYTDTPATTASGTDVTPTERMRIDNGGSVIIGAGATSGTPSADYRSLEIGRQGNTITGAPWKSNLYFSTNATITAGSTTFTYRYLNELPTQMTMEDGKFIFSNAAAPSSVGQTITFNPRMIINSDGNIGIGTLDPDHKLEVVGGLALRNSNSRLYFGTNNGTDRRALEGNVDGTLLQIGEGYSKTMMYSKVGIGTSDPSSALTVYGGGTTTSTLELRGAANGGDNATISTQQSMVFQIGSAGATGRSFSFSKGGLGYSDGTPLASIDESGNIKAKDVSGKFYSMAASWQYVAFKNDCFSYPGTDGAVWEYTIKINPNTAGSGAYRDFYYGKLGVGIGWNGSSLTQYLWQQQDQTAPRSLYDSGGGNFNPLFRMYYSSGVYTSLAYGTAWTLRIQGLSTGTFGDIFFRRLA